MVESLIRIENLSVHAGAKTLLAGIDCAIQAKQAHGFIGPSGAGKSTLLRCINRMVELTPGLQVSGQVYFHGEAVHGAGMDADALRARIGILFQQPVVFPRSILANVLFGVRHLGEVPRKDWLEAAERSLREAALWEEVKDRLKSPAKKLSVGQQQRLCLARTLAVNPEVVLMDEPTSALDPKSTEAIEELILRIKERHTVVLVTHNLRQARKVCDRLGFIGVRNEAGRLLAEGAPAEVLARRDIPELDAFLAE